MTHWYMHNDLFDGFPLSHLQSDIGRVFVEPESPETQNASWWVGPHSRRVCALSMYTQFPEELAHFPMVLDTLEPVSRDERVLAYLDTCQEIYGGLPPEGRQRRALDGLDINESQLLVENVTLPFIHGDYQPGPWARAVKRRREKEGLRRPELAPRWKSEERLRAEHPDAEQLLEHGFRPLSEEWIDASGVMDALVAGRVVVFDATKVLPRSLFNRSVVDIAAAHGDLARTIPAYNDHGGSKGRGAVESLAQYAERMQTVLLAPGSATTSHDVHRWNWAGIDHCRIPETPFWEAANILTWGVAETVLCAMRFWSHRITINARRLPMLPKFDLLQALGSPSWVARVQNLLWVGPASWNWHYDEEDNLLISLNGDMWVLVIASQGDSHLISGGLRLVEFQQGEAKLAPAFSTAFMEEHGSWFKKIPFYFLKLKPGMAITVPSMTLHTILSSDSMRILMNCFFSPKFMARESDGEPGWFRPGRQSDAHHALRSLKLASIGRLWDSRQLGGFFNGRKVELL